MFIKCSWYVPNLHQQQQLINSQVASKLKLAWAWHSSAPACLIFFSTGSCCTRKVWLMKVSSELITNLRGGSYGPPKIVKKWIFPNFWGPITSPPQTFQQFWGHFRKANFLSTTGSRWEKNQKIIILGVNWKFRFLGFFRKNLKL